ncbi:hybrid sensor histidine kinase/response regulator [Oceanicella actignis]|uniref:histidine kinase n=1 Tax=Oceanicella actignis TaxID=1189325 RepID=A0A1M7U1A0_9RHOB|nr:NahK/ErcS family hybrid sensor histidine kinase/response regulator [Oceanicella actignis]SET85684.1 signal transduction histidine kinase [Oceanicella actignis]SHN76647.1 hypothetical protein SAMN05216200_1139 [Oceanicella actignis]
MSALSILNPADDLERENAKLRKIVAALMKRVEQDTDEAGAGYGLFQTAVALEAKVRARTRDLQAAMEELNAANARLEAAKAEAEGARALLANALEAVEEGFALFSPQDRLLMCNSRFGAVTPDVRERIRPGVTFEDYVAAISRSRFLQLAPGQGPEDWLAWRLRAHRSMRGHITVRFVGDRWVQVSERRTPDGGFAILQTDITELVRAERQERNKLLDDQARLVRATLDHIIQGVCIFDADRRLAGGNARMRELLELPLTLLRRGVSFEAIAAHMNARGEVGGQARQLIDWVMQDGPRSPLSLELVRANGMILDVYCRQIPDGGFVISFTDVTAERDAIRALHEMNETLEQRVAERTEELQAAHDRAERANQSKTRFLAAASHDLLQPLNAAKLFIASLAETDLNPDQRRIAERIQSAFDSVEALLGALLDISKLDAGGAQPSVAPVALARLMGPLREEFGALAAQRGLELRVVDSSAWATTDPSYMRRILQNLVANAVRYTRAGKVLVGVRRLKGAVRIEVWDTGPGIPPEMISEIFQEFRRLRQGREDDAPGMGLGLAIVERACAALGHGLEVTSRVGAGSRFSVTAPLADPPARAAAAPAPEGGEAPRDELENLIALVVDNEAEVRAGMLSLLESWGASAVDAAGLDEALRAAEELGVAPDVILADYHLDAGADGLDVIRALRARFGPIPAALITADRSDALVRRANAAQVDVLNKPVPPGRLRALLALIAPG